MKKVLIANRGEIACRIIKSCRALGLETLADEAHRIGPPPALDSYLRGDAVIDVALASGAAAIHPGYGFLAENAGFARAVADAGMVWIGPDPKTITNMGDKARARALAEDAGVPIVPGSRRFTADDNADLEAAGAEIGFPLLVKATAGGGGIGMKRVDAPADLPVIPA